MSYEVFGDTELIGAEELAELLDDDDVLSLLESGGEEVGATRLSRFLAAKGPKSHAQSHALQSVKAALIQKLALSPQARPIASRPRPLGRAGEIPAGFESTADVAAAAEVTINVTAPVLFKPKRLLIPSTIGPSFTLNSIVIGLQSQMITASPVPCECFEERSVNQGWNMPTLQIGQAIQMTFSNVSGAAARLRGAWLGVYAD